jgi:hypothetical protein
VRYYQVRFSIWAKKQTRSPAPLAVPEDLHSLWDKMHLGIFDAPGLPDRYQPPAPRAPPASTLTPAPAPAAPAAPGVLPPLAPPSRPQVPPTPGPPGDNSRVGNPQFDLERFAPFNGPGTARAAQVRARAERTNTALPTRTNGQTRCLAFHVRGQCNASCRWAADHVNDHTPAEQQTLETWSTENWRAE